jgi:D-alanyl-D-alanine carboxypeptidase
MPKILDDRLAGIDSDAPADSEELARQQAVKQTEARRRFKISTAAGRMTVLLMVLGLVIEKVTGHPFGQELQQHILKPLALSRTELATTRRLPDLDDPGTNPNLPWAAGGIVSDTQDLARFFSALLSGHLVSRASLANMKQTVAAGPSQDGLGIFATSLPCGRFWGHNGGILDYGTLVDASGNGARIAAVSVRGPTGQPPDESALLCPSSPRNSS